MLRDNWRKCHCVYRRQESLRKLEYLRDASVGWSRLGCDSDGD